MSRKYDGPYSDDFKFEECMSCVHAGGGTPHVCDSCEDGDHYEWDGIEHDDDDEFDDSADARDVIRILEAA